MKTNYYTRFGRSSWSAISCPAQVVEAQRDHRNEELGIWDSQSSSHPPSFDDFEAAVITDVTVSANGTFSRRHCAHNCIDLRGDRLKRWSDVANYPCQSSSHVRLCGVPPIRYQASRFFFFFQMLVTRVNPLDA